MVNDARWETLAEYTVPDDVLVAADFSNAQIRSSQDGFDAAEFAAFVYDQFGHKKRMVGTLTTTRKTGIPSPPRENTQMDFITKMNEMLTVEARSPTPLDSHMVHICIPAIRKQMHIEKAPEERFVLSDVEMEMHDVGGGARAAKTTVDEPDREPDLREIADMPEPERLKRPHQFEDELDRWWYNTQRA